VLPDYTVVVEVVGIDVSPLMETYPAKECLNVARGESGFGSLDGRAFLDVHILFSSLSSYCRARLGVLRTGLRGKQPGLPPRSSSRNSGNSYCRAAL